MYRSGDGARRWRRAWAGLVVVGAGLVSGHLLAKPFHVTTEAKVLSGLEWSPTPFVPEASTPTLGPLPLRLIDAGGVGIPADTSAWGSTYSHATHVFEHLFLDGPPWIDPAVARQVQWDWRRYVRRMSEYGSNGVAVDAFLQLVNFDGVGTGNDVYAADDPLRPRHDAFRMFLEGLIQDADAVGMDVYLKTDLPTVTPQLQRYIQQQARASDTGRPRFWTPYAQAFDELFTQMPGIAGVVVRIGEAGPLFNVGGTPYSSYMGVRTPAQLRTMLDTLLPTFERHGRTLIFRSWSVGLGALGQLHNERATYEEALSGLDSPALIVSTKFVQGDYFGFLPINPTLQVGRHRRLIEYQARREFEGFGALPNYLGRAHGSSLRQLREANPNIVGISLWAQEGGPLRTGPLSLYDVTGFWRWTDATVYATTRLAQDPSQDPSILATEWAQRTFGGTHPSGRLPDPVAAQVSDLLLTSREALEKAWYIRPYARQRVEIAGIEVPPILWIFEWDVVGGWSSVLSTLYRTVSDEADDVIGEGYEAVKLTAGMLDRLRSLEPDLAGHPDYSLMLRSIEYQMSLFETLADFRRAFLLYYRWLDQGGEETTWRNAGHAFLVSAEDHRVRYGGDLDFPALDFAPATRFVADALRSGDLRLKARGLLLVSLLALLLGLPRFRRSLAAFPGGSWPHVLAVATISAASVGLLFASGWTMGLGAFVLTAAFGSVVVAGPTMLTSTPPSWDSRLPPAAGVPAVILLAAVPLTVAAIRGPDQFWYLFWSNDAFRALVFGLGVTLLIWMLTRAHRHAAHRVGSDRRGAAVVSSAVGATFVLLSILLPDLDVLLAALDDPLGFFPMTHAIVNAILHYAAVPVWITWAPAILGAMLLGLGARLAAPR